MMCDPILILKEKPQSYFSPGGATEVENLTFLLVNEDKKLNLGLRGKRS